MSQYAAPQNALRHASESVLFSMYTTRAEQTMQSMAASAEYVCTINSLQVVDGCEGRHVVAKLVFCLWTHL